MAAVPDNEKIQVLFITYYWPPSGGAGVQRCLKFVKNLPAYNIIPTVVTVSEKGASYQVLDESLAADIPTGTRVIRTSTNEPFEYYKKLTGKKEIPYGGFANEQKGSLVQKFFKFLRGNLFIPDARVGWNKFALKDCADLLAKEKFAAIITTSPPHSTQLIGLELQQKFKIKWIADLRDPWTDIYYYKDLQHTTVAKKIDQNYERAVIQKADALLVTSTDTKRLFLAKAPEVESAKISVIPNGYDEEDFTLPSAPPPDAFVITYTGTLTEIYNIEAFLKALAKITTVHPDIPFQLRFVGKVSAEVKAQIEDAGLQHLTHLIPFVPHSESVKYLLSSTILLMGIPDVENNYCILPGKLFEYLAANKPIVCIGPIHSDADHIIDECGAGRVFHYAAFDLIYDHLDQLSHAWKINHNLDLPFVNYQRYSRFNLTGELAKIIRD
ncbi:glycosyl transferase family 1 [Adhaeribacter aerolatus]|uniref:Glycosyl transferase family 1 n=1 Tax=Adhaeribacter aerolatus TaxID=670289 RepID=A0A512AY44_9BACT|nr:glycosyltransferase family 4 protein [Adhaeribacter aerolatus]GEO04638.1 glycosyl transferase family 1 [Adhaeribacter aerolatus]